MRADLALEALSAQFVERLEAAGIPALVLKGPLQARRLHGDVGYRRSNDVDLLVERVDLATAADALAPLGYRLSSAMPTRRCGLPDLHTVLRNESARLPRIDLHWRVHWYEEAFSHALLANSRKRGTFLEPDARDDLTALLLFYARDGFYGLRAAADIAGWCRLHPANGRPQLTEQWDNYPRLRRPLAAAALAAERTVGVPATQLVPESGLSQTTPRLAVNLTSWNRVGDPDQLRANIAVVDALLSPPDELGNFARRELFVTRPEIEAIYGLPSSARVRIALMRIVHAPKVLARQIAGLWSAIRPPRARRVGE